VSAPPPAIILVRPQLAENIGTAARAMLNCGLTDLRLVKPRPTMPHPRAIAACSGADSVIESARIFASVEEAAADLDHLYATTARARDQLKPVVTARQAAIEFRNYAASGERVGYLFGPERTGLENEELLLADALVSVPLNPKFSSLNLAQAVLLLAYEWRMAGDATAPRRSEESKEGRASKQEQAEFFKRLEAELDACGFLRNTHMRPTMVQNIRNIFLRGGLMKHEVRTLHGVLTGLTQRPHAPRPKAKAPASAADKPPRSRRVPSR
jgi:tRNA/rRNA methyltransferase